MINKKLLGNIDWLLLGLAFLICSIGVLTVYSATTKQINSPFSRFYVKQLYWIGCGFVVMLVIMAIDYHVIGKASYLLYVINIGAIIASYLVHKKIAHVGRWIKIAGFTVQPSEFMKVVFILILAKYLHEQKRNVLGFKHMIVPGIILAVPLVLIIKQPDLGTAMLLVPVFMCVIFLAGLKPKVLVSVLIAGLLFAFPMWFTLKPYQKARISSFMDPQSDPMGSGYHLIQSKIAVGSGGLFGSGYLQGTQSRLNFIPAQHTDFIFSVFAEEWGFSGSVGLLLLFLFFLFRGMEIAVSASDKLGMLTAVGIVCMFAFHVFVNIGMVIGMMPITGFPLSFFSYGGSAMLTNFACLGMLLNIRMRRFTRA